ncbi:hypothetical protein [Phocaeicola coprophilus]|uniref:hypothetical protein n=2 Tax=Phocaeicola coprophilus TaxID=387090 RepID=UPI003993833B
MAGQIKKITVGGETYDIGGGISAPISTTYAELKSIKDAKQLVIGQKYRITDFVSLFKSTYQTGNHAFDLIIEANSESSFSEQATAIHHVGDDYFANSNLAAWEISYCFDNDTTRFPFASSEGKGFIYKMVDEFNNEAPFDFKNIKFNLQSSQYDFITEGNIYAYTFSVYDSNISESRDASLNQDNVTVKANVIKEPTVSCFFVKNPNEFLKTAIENNTLEYGGNARVIYSDYTSLTAIRHNIIKGIAYIETRKSLSNNVINFKNKASLIITSSAIIENTNIWSKDSDTVIKCDGTNITYSEVKIMNKANITLTGCTLNNTNIALNTLDGGLITSSISSQNFSAKNVKINQDGTYKAIDPFA